MSSKAALLSMAATPTSTRSISSRRWSSTIRSERQSCTRCSSWCTSARSLPRSGNSPF
jgi:hypothetical protein